MLPCVSLPIEKPTSPAAVAAAEPADDPEEPCLRFQGLRVFPPYQRSPAARLPSDKFGDQHGAGGVESFGDGRFEVEIAGLCSCRRPRLFCSRDRPTDLWRPRGYRVAGRDSDRRRCRGRLLWLVAIAVSSVSVTTHLSFSSYFFKRSMYSRINRSLLSLPARISRDSCDTGMNASAASSAGRSGVG